LLEFGNTQNYYGYASMTVTERS